MRCPPGPERKPAILRALRPSSAPVDEVGTEVAEERVGRGRRRV